MAANKKQLDFFTRQLESKPITDYCRRVPLPTEDERYRQDLSISGGIRKMAASQDHAVAILDVDRTRLTGYARPEPAVKWFPDIPNHTGNWGAVAFGKHAWKPGWVYAVSAAELLCVAGCVPEGIDRLVCVDDDPSKLDKLASHGICILYAEGNYPQLLPNDTFSINITSNQAWYENDPWSRPKKSPRLARENFCDDEIGADKQGLRLNLEPGPVAPKTLAYYKAHLIQESLRDAAEAMLGLSADEGRYSSSPAKRAADYARQMYLGLSCGMEREIPWAVDGFSWRSLDPGRACLAPGNKLLDSYGKEAGDAPRGEIALPGKFIDEYLEPSRRQQKRVEGVVRIWQKAMGRYSFVFSEPLDRLCAKHGDGFAAFMDGTAELLGLKPALEALFAGVPVEDVLAGI